MIIGSDASPVRQDQHLRDICIYIYIYKYICISCIISKNSVSHIICILV